MNDALTALEPYYESEDTATSPTTQHKFTNKDLERIAGTAKL